MDSSRSAGSRPKRMAEPEIDFFDSGGGVNNPTLPSTDTEGCKYSVYSTQSVGTWKYGVGSTQRQPVPNVHHD